MVIQSGGGFMANKLVGKRVAFTRQTKVEGIKQFYVGGGTYQQYVVTKSLNCVTLNDNISYEVGSMSFVNPMTAFCLLNNAKTYGSQTAVVSAAFSQVGRMINKINKQIGIKIINIVRKDAQVKALKEEYGAEYVLNSTDPDFIKNLAEMSKELKATSFIDCMGGDFTASVLEAMPRKTRCFFYGSLITSTPFGNISPMLLIGKDSSIQGFILSHALKDMGIRGILKTIGQVKEMMNDKQFQSPIKKRLAFSEFHDSIPEYLGDMSGGKFILCPQEVDDALKDAKDDDEVFKIVNMHFKG